MNLRQSRLLHSIFRFDLPPIAFAGVLLLTGLAFGLFRTPSLLFAYSDADCLTYLFANGYFSSITRDLFPITVIPFQQTNVSAAILIKIAQWIPAPSPIVLWLGSALLGLLFLQRSLLLFPPSTSIFTRSIFLGLLLIHPYFWIQLTTSPGAVITALLSIEIVVRYKRFQKLGAFGCLCLFLLSICGSDGFVWAAALAIYLLVDAPVKTKRNSEIPWNRIAAILCALVPMGLIYGSYALQLSSTGGTKFPEYGTAFSNVCLAPMLKGEWTLHATKWLLWTSNGFLNTSYFFPFFGLLALLGIVDSWSHTSEFQSLNKITVFLSVAALMLFSFASPLQSHHWSMPLFPLALFFALRGTRWIASAFSFSHNAALGVASAILAVLITVNTPVEWQSIIARARYYHTLNDTLDREIDPLLERVEDAVALRFDPVVFARLPNAEKMYPLGLSIECPFETYAGRLEGIYFDVRFAPAPIAVIDYPRFDEKGDSESRLITPTQMPRIQEVLKGNYISSQTYNFTVYQRKEDSREIVKTWLASAWEEGYIIETSILPDWFRTRFPFERDDAIFLAEESLPQSVGPSWNLERDYSNARQTGSTFGFRPSTDNRASGLRGAGSGTDESQRGLGVLRSLPFVIEGDEMTFFADIPKDSTASVFCLAVYEKTPVGENAQVKQVRHLFERKTGEPLMGETFFYILSQHLTYWPGEVRGWRVVRLLQDSDADGRRFERWSLDPWKNQQAVWMAADRDLQSIMCVDAILQWKRAPGLYVNFERGDYGDWPTTGEAFGAGPVVAPIGGQTAVTGYEGNYFVNSFFQGSDAPIGTLRSPLFRLQWDRMEFSIGGGHDEDALYVCLRVDGETVLKATGEQNETLRNIVWDVSPWKGRNASLEIVDLSSQAWGHILADDFRLYSSPTLKKGFAYEDESESDS